MDFWDRALLSWAQLPTIGERWQRTTCRASAPLDIQPRTSGIEIRRAASGAEQLVIQAELEGLDGLLARSDIVPWIKTCLPDQEDRPIAAEVVIIVFAKSRQV